MYLREISAKRYSSKCPVGWQQSRQAVGGMGRDAREYVAEVGEGIDLMTVATGDQAEEDRGGVPAGVASAEEPVLSVMRSPRLCGVVGGSMLAHGVQPCRHR
jgi:hypothetical protein